jgi:hypothetical protein
VIKAKRGVDLMPLRFGFLTELSAAGLKATHWIRSITFIDSKKVN